jgi:hypothetical protein
VTCTTTPPREPPLGCASPGFAGRPRAASRAPRPPGRGAQTALQARIAVGAKHPRLNSAGAASFARRTSLLQEVVCGKVAARGRAASPTKRGRIVRCDNDISPWVFRKGYKSGVPTLYPSFDGRGLSDAPCSIARSRHFGRRHQSAALGFGFPLFEECIPC